MSLFFDSKKSYNINIKEIEKYIETHRPDYEEPKFIEIDGIKHDVRYSRKLGSYDINQDKIKYVDGKPDYIYFSTLLLGMKEKTFSERLKKHIIDKGLKGVTIYKKANIEKSLYSKIINDAHYSPTKPTVFAFIIALELSPTDANILLASAGYCLSRSSDMDIIMEYCINRGIYDIFEINRILYHFDLPILGSK